MLSPLSSVRECASSPPPRRSPRLPPPPPRPRPPRRRAPPPPPLPPSPPAAGHIDFNHGRYVGRQPLHADAVQAVQERAAVGLLGGGRPHERNRHLHPHLLPQRYLVEVRVQDGVCHGGALDLAEGGGAG